MTLAPATLYTDNDPFCCKVLRARIADESLPGGDVLEKDIREVTADDLAGYEVVHLFAGIGGFGLAQKWAGWKGSLLTGGPPCQPFSSASRGRRNGTEDDRYLWPEMFRIIQETRPSRVLFENVTHIDGMALEEVVSDLEICGYETAPPLEIPACAIGQDHRRARNWVCGFTNGNGQSRLSVDAEMAKLQKGRGNSASLGRNNGIPGGLDRNRLAALGNAIVPQVAEQILKAMKP